jgi:hypothetical protein
MKRMPLAFAHKMKANRIVNSSGSVRVDSLCNRNGCPNPVGLPAPYADMQVAVLDWLSISVRAGYVWSPLSYDWHDAGLPDAPNLTLDGLFVHATIAFGGIFGLEDDGE